MMENKYINRNYIFFYTQKYLLTFSKCKITAPGNSKNIFTTVIFFHLFIFINSFYLFYFLKIFQN